MKYTLIEADPGPSLAEFADKHGLELVVKQTPGGKSYHAFFRGYTLAYDYAFSNAYDNGRDIQTAIQLFADAIEGRTLRSDKSARWDIQCPPYFREIG
jgi:hypothetical protein